MISNETVNREMGQIIALAGLPRHVEFASDPEQALKEFASMWHKGVRDLDEELFVRACEEWRCRCTVRDRFPMPGDIREIAEEIWTPEPRRTELHKPLTDEQRRIVHENLNKMLEALAKARRFNDTGRQTTAE